MVQLKSGGHPWFNDLWRPRPLRNIVSHSANTSGVSDPARKKWERGVCELDSHLEYTSKHLILWVTLHWGAAVAAPASCFLNHPVKLEIRLLTLLLVPLQLLGSPAHPCPQDRSDYKGQSGLLLFFFLLAPACYKRFIFPCLPFSSSYTPSPQVLIFQSWSCQESTRYNLVPPIAILITTIVMTGAGQMPSSCWRSENAIPPQACHTHAHTHTQRQPFPSDLFNLFPLK